MAGRIYTRSQEGSLEPLEEIRFSSEDTLQELIADHPELLDREQMRPGDPRRWILVAREQGIADEPGSTARWSLDHLLIGQDAVPTLVEVKRVDPPGTFEEAVDHCVGLGIQNVAIVGHGHAFSRNRL